MLLLHTVHVCAWIHRDAHTLFTIWWNVTDKAEQTTVSHMFSHLLGLLWSYDFSWSSPLVHSKRWNHTICFQGNVLTTDKHSSNCGGNTFFPSKLLCVSLSDRSTPPHDHGERGAALKGPFLSCYTTGGHCSVCLHTGLFVSKHFGHRHRERWPVRRLISILQVNYKI